MTLRHALLGLMIPVAIVGCSDNPVAVDDHDDGDEPLTVALTFSTEHVETLSEMTFTVTITDHHGDPFNDFETVTVEYRLEGETEWNGIDLTQAATVWQAPFTFVTSGEYELRVTGMRHGSTTTEVLYDEHTHLDVERIHVEVATYRFEFESFPGHMHEGEMAMLKFWVLERDPDASGVHQPITGLEAEIHCEEEAGFTESHPAAEMMPGIYQAGHTFAEAGEFHAGLHIHDPAGDVEVEFHMHVAHGH